MSDPQNPGIPGIPGIAGSAGGTGEDGPDGVGNETEAASAALRRVRAAARAKGLRPGVRPRRRRRDVPVSQRTDDTGRDPQLIGDEIDALIAGRGWEVDVAVGSVIGRWPQIVGPDIAAHCVPVSFTEGVLTVRAESSAWATQLRLLSSTLLARLADEVGAETVGELRILGPGGPSWSRGPIRATDGRGPRDTYG